MNDDAPGPARTPAHPVVRDIMQTSRAIDAAGTEDER